MISKLLKKMFDKGFWIYAAMKKCAESLLTIRFDPKVMILISFLYQNVGINMMFLYAMQYWAKINNKSEFTFDDFVNIYPMGIPTAESLQEIWYNQKVKSQPDNLIDYSSAVKSIL